MFFLVLITILGVLISRSPVFAGDAKFWRTVEQINGYSPTDTPFPKISTGGRYVVFHSNIANLVPNDSNNFCDTDRDGVADNSCADIFVYDREAKTTTLVSVSSTGTQGNQRSVSPSISPDARYITFGSQASNLVPDGAHICLYFRVLLRQCADIFVHDRDTGTTERVSVNSGGTKANGNSGSPSISADGRYIAFSSEASNLVPNGIHICPDLISGQCVHIFVHDRQTGTTERVSVASSSERGNNGSYRPSISADGHHVAFLSTASNLVPNDNNGRFDAFVRHLDTGQTVLISIASNGTQGNQDVELITPAISEDGRYVAFASKATNLVANDTNGMVDVFVRDLQAGTTVRASVAADGSQANFGSGTYSPSLSSDGRYVLFDSWATNLVPGDTNGLPDIFVRDLQAGATTRVSVAQDGSQANHSSSAGAISADGGFASFSSTASNLTPEDLNNAPDIFVAETFSSPTVPYLSQKDPAWGTQEYDHANTIGPFFCGTTIGGCGCAITSSTMLLKYYGVEKSPDGLETNPDTLNTWLKANYGYAFDALKWNSIASYALKANQNFPSQQKIKFVGTGPPNDFDTLNQDLSNNKPPILEEPNHFIVATGQQTPTYSINDPAWENRKTLDAYSNQFLSMRRYATTTTDLSAIYISSPAPTELLITDSLDRRTGKNASGAVFNEIPNSFYFLEPTLADQTNQTQPSPDSGIQTLVILTPQQDTYNIEVFSPQDNYSIDFSAYDQNGDIQVKQFNQTLTQGSVQKYELGYSPKPGSQMDLKQKVQIDVKPGDDRNQINLNQAILQVAILSTPDFNSENTDIVTVRLGNAAIPPFKDKVSFISRNEDRTKDLLLLFRTRELNLTKTDNQLCLEGSTLQGVPFQGCDSIEIIGPDPP